jgi:hypothetical protein
MAPLMSGNYVKCWGVDMDIKWVALTASDLVLDIIIHKQTWGLYTIISVLSPDVFKCENRIRKE